MNSKNYGSAHSQEKKKAVEDRGLFCEVTGASGYSNDIEAHHSQPRYLNGPDVKENYVLLEKGFHRALHDATWSEHPKLISERSKLKRFLFKRPDHEAARKRLEEIDGVLIPEYIHKLLNKLPFDLRENVVETTLVSTYSTVTRLTLEVLSLRKELEEVQNVSNK